MKLLVSCRLTAVPLPLRIWLGVEEHRRGFDLRLMPAPMARKNQPRAAATERRTEEDAEALRPLFRDDREEERKASPDGSPDHVS